MCTGDTCECKLLISLISCLLTEIQRNRDFYRYSDVRPPFTYATLIRQVRTPICLHILTYLFFWLPVVITEIFRLLAYLWETIEMGDEVIDLATVDDQSEFYQPKPQSCS